MTNREYMHHLLADPDWIDDGGAAYTSMVLNNIACPYIAGDQRCHCKGENRWLSNFEKQCEDCKLEWLEMEVDE